MAQDQRSLDEPLQDREIGSAHARYLFQYRLSLSFSASPLAKAKQRILSDCIVLNSCNHRFHESCLRRIAQTRERLWMEKKQTPIQGEISYRPKPSRKCKTSLRVFLAYLHFYVFIVCCTALALGERHEGCVGCTLLSGCYSQHQTRFCCSR